MQTASPLVSVIIPNYNYGQYLAQAIDSVLAQSYPYLEVIIVDDGSTDHSADVARGYGERIQWIQQHRQGVAAARNRGVQESRGALVAFLDADDFWMPEKVTSQVSRWVANPEIGLVHCGAQLINVSGQVQTRQQDGLEGWIAHEMLLFQRCTIVCTGSSAMIPRKVFDEVGGFDTRLSTSADWDICYRISTHRPVGFVSDALIAVRMHQTNMHANIPVMESDMLLAYAKAFEQADPSIRALRRRSYGNLHMVLGASFAHAGHWSKAARHILTGVWLTPDNIVRLFRFPLRWWHRRKSVQDGRTGRETIHPHVLYISYDGALEPLGQSQVIPYLKGLAGHGAHITLLSFEKPSDQRDSGRREMVRTELTSAGIRWMPLTYHKYPAGISTAFDICWGTARAWRVLWQDGITIVHARSYVAAVMAWMLKRVSGVPFVFDMRGFWADERVEGGLWGRTSVLYRIAKSLERHMLQDADAVITLTEQAKQTVQQWGGDRVVPITVIPTCVDLDRFSRTSPSHGPPMAPVFIYTGSVGTWYAFPELLRFMERAVQRFPGATLLLLTRQTAEAEKALRHTSLPAKAVTMVSVDASEVPAWLALAHVGLAFYTSGFSRQGTCPTKIGEYLAMGLPVVVNSWVGDMAGLVNPAGVGVTISQHSTTAYDQALNQLESLWADSHLADRCRALAEHVFSLEIGIQRYWHVYEQLAPGMVRQGVAPLRSTETGDSPQPDSLDAADTVSARCG